MEGLGVGTTAASRGDSRHKPGPYMYKYVAAYVFQYFNHITAAWTFFV